MHENRSYRVTGCKLTWPDQSAQQISSWLQWPAAPLQDDTKHRSSLMHGPVCVCVFWQTHFQFKTIPFTLYWDRETSWVDLSDWCCSNVLFWSFLTCYCSDHGHNSTSFKRSCLWGEQQQSICRSSLHVLRDFCFEHRATVWKYIASTVFKDTAEASFHFRHVTDAVW